MSVDFPVILSDCALENKRQLGIVVCVAELGREKEEDLIVMEANC